MDTMKKNKPKNRYVLTSFNTTHLLDDYISELSDQESEIQDRRVSKGEIYRTIIKEHKDRND